MPRATSGAVPAGITRPNAVEVDLDAITHNLGAIRSEADAGTRIFGAVKANGYGLGLPAVAEAIVAGGGDGFGLSDPADALKIRRAGIDAPILMYGGMLPGAEAGAFARRWGAMLSVAELEAAVAVEGSARSRTDVIVEVDVGLERLGVGVDDAAELVKTVNHVPGVRLMGITTHLHGIGPGEYLEWQLARFKEVVDTLAIEGVDLELRLGESSATLGTGSHPSLNAVDPGHLLYGLIPRGRADRPSWLRSALIGVTSRILQVRSVSRHEFVSESPLVAEQPTRIGVIPMGSADGLRLLSCGEVLVRGRRCRIVGGMSLEHTRIDLSAVPEAERGDEVMVVGKQGEQEITPQEVEQANALGSAGLGVVAAASVRRVYREPR
jgi:alanine racemase